MALLAVVIPAAVFVALSRSCGTPVPENGVVVTESGRVQGELKRDAWAWRSIPYAAPPVGPLRWRAPQRPESWEGIREAKAVEPLCTQALRMSEGKIGVTGSEDCLMLAVWRPKTAPSEPLPVVVFIHPGAFTSGGTFWHSGRSFAAEGNVVVVMINYRLGAFGFLHADAGDQPASGDSNVGLRDQIAALEWVQRNIAAFGGDPSRVTLLGHSAGSASVHALLSAPSAEGLFSGAVMHSGTVGGLTLDDDRGIRERLLAAGGCRKAADPLECLRGRPAADIARLGVKEHWGPILDGDVLHRSPEVAFVEGQQHRVPLVIGSVAREVDSTTITEWSQSPATWKLYRNAVWTAEDYRAIVEARFGVLADDVLGLYSLSDYPTPQDALAAADSDFMTCHIDRLALAAAQMPGMPVWRFVFKGSTEDSGPNAWRSLHGKDIDMLFDEETASLEDEAISMAMIRYWSRFAATGDPNGGGDPNWPSYGAAKSFLSIGTPVSVDRGGVGRNCGFWNGPTPPPP